MPPGLESSRVFLAEGASLAPLDLTTGQSRWKTDIAAPAVWVGYLADKLLAASSQRVAALDLNTGAEQWRFAPGGPSRPRRGPDPFTRPEPASASPDRARVPLHDFQLVGGRLFCLRGDEEILALDGDTGSIDWTFSPRGSPINPKLWIGPERIVLQVQKPNQLLVLETETGRQLGRAPLPEGESLERPPAPLDEDHVLLVTDRRTVKKFDMVRGQFSWDYRESLEMPVNGPPRVIVDAERVLVLHDGKNLIRLDPVNGSKRWQAVLGIEDLSERTDAILCDPAPGLLRQPGQPEGALARRWKRALDVPPEWTGERPVVDRAFRAVRGGLSLLLGRLGRRDGEHARRGAQARHRRPGATIRVPRDDRRCELEAGWAGGFTRDVTSALGACSDQRPARWPDLRPCLENTLYGFALTGPREEISA